VNAKKANTKRVYFQEKNFDLLNPEDYQVGMKTFKEDTLGNIKHYLELQKKAGLYIKIVFHMKADVLNIYIANNTTITKKEQMRVYDRIARARAYDSLEEAFSMVLDDSEGAGLGIVIMILMLRKMGLDEEAFDIDTENSETVARLSIPVAKIHVDHLHEISNLLAEKLEHIPQFPENVATLQRQLGDPDVEMNDIARSIATDPALTADLLKLVNSAAFMLPKRVDNIAEAVKLVGLRGLKNLLYSYGTQKILGDETIETRGLWLHSYKTAFFGYNLAKNILKRRDILDDVYVGGILHDMGKIIFSSVHPELLTNIRRFCEERSIPSHFLEDISAGLNHAEIGARIAEKWNFPENLVAAIRHHHDPSQAPRRYREMIDVIYMANSLANYGNEHSTIEELDGSVLRRFNIASEGHLMVIKDRLDTAFEHETSNQHD
jgi:putative nucleotidyltransferase with HDIG domain